MKVILLNGSPRKNWNTHKLLIEAEQGAKEMGGENGAYSPFRFEFQGLQELLCL